MSSKNRPIYVLDTNILVDYYRAFFPNGDGFVPKNPTINVENAHIVIPDIVIRELNNFKKDQETTTRRKAAREILRRIRKVMEGSNISSDEVCHLRNPVAIPKTSNVLTILTLSKSFQDGLSFRIDEDDWDSKIMATALFAKQSVSDTTLLTNDNAFASRASSMGVATSRYGFHYPAPYTGRRELEVPFDLYHRWAADKQIPLSLWQEHMPSEEPLVANEFIIMSCTDWEENIRGYTNIGRYDPVAEAIVPLQYFRKFPTPLSNPGQVIYAEALYHPSIDAVIATGPAGTGKTYMATVYALEACRLTSDYLGIVVVPCHVEDRIGFLPGDLDDKLDPLVGPIKKSLQKYLLKTAKNTGDEEEEEECFDEKGKKTKRSKKVQKSPLKALLNEVANIWKNWFDNVDVDTARGLDFGYLVAFYDEFQDQKPEEADTLIKRIGEGGKMIITGDTEQVHASYLAPDNNGLTSVCQELKDYPMVAQVSFTEDEVVRHPLVKLLVQRQKAARESASNPASENN